MTKADLLEKFRAGYPEDKRQFLNIWDDPRLSPFQDDYWIIKQTGWNKGYDAENSRRIDQITPLKANFFIFPSNPQTIEPQRNVDDMVDDEKNVGDLGGRVISMLEFIAGVETTGRFVKEAEKCLTAGDNKRALVMSEQALNIEPGNSRAARVYRVASERIALRERIGTDGNDPIAEDAKKKPGRPKVAVA